MTAFALEFKTIGDEQAEHELCFVGGQPSMPDEMPLPSCGLCGNQQTFFFQVAFPTESPWAGLSLATFECTSCAHEDHLIPRLLTPLVGADVPKGFLDDYQVNFRFLVFPTRSAVRRTDYKSRVAYREWSLVRPIEQCFGGFKIGGQPTWELEDETPAVYAGSVQFAFLLQVPVDFHFETVHGAPPQVRLDPTPTTPNGEQLTENYYELFVANALYLFGTTGTTDRLVYAVVQSD